MMVRLPCPPSTNNLFANGRNGRYTTDKYAAWQKDAGWMLNLAKPQSFGNMKEYGRMNLKNFYMLLAMIALVGATAAKSDIMFWVFMVVSAIWWIRSITSSESDRA